MQHPVGYTLNSTGHPSSTTLALFTNPVFLWGYTHVLLASAVTGALVMLAVSAWHLRRELVDSFRLSATISLVVLLPAITLNLFVGSHLGIVESKYQPMKIAAAEGHLEHLPAHAPSRSSRSAGADDETTSLEIPTVPIIWPPIRGRR